MYFSLTFKLIFKIAILGQSVTATFIDKAVPADLEDCASKAECKDKDGQEIHAAAKSGNIEIIGLLLSRGFEVDSRDEKCTTPLMYTALNGHEGAFQMLIQNGADPSLKSNKGFSLLHSAAHGGNTSIINKLLSLGLDVDLKDLYGKTPLIIAIEKNNSDAVKLLLSKGVQKSA